MLIGSIPAAKEAAVTLPPATALVVNISSVHSSAVASQTYKVLSVVRNTICPSNEPSAGKLDTGSIPYAPASWNRAFTSAVKASVSTCDDVPLTELVCADL